MKRYLCSVPAVLSGLPVGPLYPHIASFVQGLGPQGYSSCAINQKIRLLRRLDEWFVHRHIGIGSFDDALIERFLCLRRKGGHVQLGDPTTLRSFLNHLREQHSRSPPVDQLRTVPYRGTRSCPGDTQTVSL